MPHPDLSLAKTPLALAIDIGSSSVRAVLFDANGHQVRNSEHRERYKLEITPDGGSMCDPLRIRRLTARCIQRVCDAIGDHVGEVEVVGISCHWHSLMGLDRNGTPVTPVYMWSDKRSSRDADDLASELTLDDTHTRTGCRLHSSYWPAKLRWLARTRTPIVESVALWCGLPDWLIRPDGSDIDTSLSMASATGLLNTASQDWDANLASHLKLGERSLPTLTNRTSSIGRENIHPDLLPPRLSATWYPALGDGAAANIGAGAVGPDRIALTIGTSGAIRVARKFSGPAPLPPGLFRYLIDHETEVLGGALSNGGNMIAWISNLSQSKDRREMMRQASLIAPDGHGLTMLPFFAGERAPSWHDHLRGTITGMSLDTTNIHILRAMMEATAYRFSSVYDALREFVVEEHQIVANGGALLQSPVWSQITADALGHTISALFSRTEASARGAAISALNAHGMLSSMRTDPAIGTTYTPDDQATLIYQRGRKRLESLEAALTQWEHNNR